MPIIAPLPNNIHNGDALDAVPVMANFNQILTNVNSNAADLHAQNTFSQPQNGVNAILGSQFPTLSQVQALILAAMPTGTMLDWAGSGAAPAGYALCDGSAYDRVAQANLFAVIGTTWGAGNGTTTFNVPDMRRRAAIGSGGTAVVGPGITVGSIGGSETHVLTVAELAAHNHGVNDAGHGHGVTDPSHSHTINDPGHNHSINDPGHFHGFTIGSNTGGNAPSVITAVNATGNNNTYAVGTGISLNASGTGVNALFNTTGVTVNSATSNISTQNNGSNSAINLWTPVAVVTKIIKL